jgi:PiT family inorganic phosphate transporter
MMNWQLISGLFLGWSLGANDSANVFGTAVATRMVRYRTAVFLCAFFVLLGAIVDGQAGFHTLSNLVQQDGNQVFICSLGAAVTVTMMSIIGIPVSTSQAMVGSIVGIGLASAQVVNTSGLGKVIICWVGTPVGSFFVALVLYKFFQFLFRRMRLNFFHSDFIFRWGLILAGIYGSYALGANNVANVTGVYVGAGILTVKQAAILGGVSIGIGAITYSKNVMMTVGKNLIPLNGLGAFVAILAQAIVVHFYSLVGVPVSTSQAIVGAVIAVGLINGRNIRLSVLKRIFQGWVMTPLLAGAMTAALYSMFS